MKITIHEEKIEFEAETQHEKDALTRITNHSGGVEVRSGNDPWSRTPEPAKLIIELPKDNWGT